MILELLRDRKRALLLKLCKSRDIYYIGGSDALPPPLSPEEEKKLIGQLVVDDAAKDAKTEEDCHVAR